MFSSLVFRVQCLVLTFSVHVLRTVFNFFHFQDEVCSPGGSTIRGVQKLEEGGVRAAFMSAVQVQTKLLAYFDFDVGSYRHRLISRILNESHLMNRTVYNQAAAQRNEELGKK